MLLNRAVAGCLALVALSGCQRIGPEAIALGRLGYNEVIQKTTKTQNFANIIRARNYEPTEFVNVTQISAGILAQATLTGGAASIGARSGPRGAKLTAGTGNAGIALQYQETPTIQYQPLLGEALVSQVISPITATSISSLFDSDWPLASLLSFAVDRLTPGYADFASAIDALIALDDLGAITLSAQIAESTGHSSSGPNRAAGAPSRFSVLAITLEASHPHPLVMPQQADEGAVIDSLWCRLTTVIDPSTPCSSRVRTVLLGASASSGFGQSTNHVSYALRTRSALGILNAATGRPHPLLAFVSLAEFRKIKGSPWNRNGSCDAASFYTLLPDEEDPSDHPASHPSINKQVSEFIRSSQTGDYPRSVKCLLTSSVNLDPGNYHESLLEERLAGLRRFILIIVSDTEPDGSYVSYNDGEHWYYIDKNDEISKRNFVLISQFLRIQAIPTQPLALTPTIAVGPR